MAMFQQISAACRRLDAQLLIAHCGGLNRAQERTLQERGATWVTDYAPQQWVLEQADVLVTHGGLNTVMDSIAARTPMLVMPVAFDQPGVAARVRYRGLGEQLHRRAGASAIHASLLRLLDQPTDPLLEVSAQLNSAGGINRASDVIEAVVRTHAPVVARTTHDL